MKERSVKMLVWIICLVAPLLPTYIVLAVIYPVFNIIGVILVSIIEYFGFMYIIALFIQRMAMMKQRKDQELLKMKEAFRE